jgi:hypothetical protein
MLLILTGKRIYPQISVTRVTDRGMALYPVAGNGYGFRYVMKVTGIQRCYPQIVYSLPSSMEVFITAAWLI